LDGLTLCHLEPYSNYLAVNKSKEKMKKINIILLLAGLVSLFLIIIEYAGTYFWCDLLIKNGHESGCPFVMSDIKFILFPIIPLFIFSLITYKMRDEVFQFWWKFARIWIPLSMFAIIISPSTGNWMIPIEKGNVALFSMILFTISSVFIIVCKHFQLKK